MSIYYSKFLLNTYAGTPYFQSQLPDGYPLNLILQRCRAFRRLPKNLKALSGLSKVWLQKHNPSLVNETKDWYDDAGYELNPETGRRLNDVEIDAEWLPNPQVDMIIVRDILLPSGGFNDPETWEETVLWTDTEDRPSQEQLKKDILWRGRKATAQAYGLSESQLPDIDQPDHKNEEEIVGIATGKDYRGPAL